MLHPRAPFGKGKNSARGNGARSATTRRIEISRHHIEGDRATFCADCAITHARRGIFRAASCQKDETIVSSAQLMSCLREFVIAPQRSFSCSALACNID
jgi:hypothetical protein